MAREVKRAAETEPGVALSELPEGWRWERLGDVLPLEYGKSLPGRDRDHTGLFPVYGSSGIVGQHSNALVEGPVLLVGRKGSAGSVFYETGSCWPIDTAYFAHGGDQIDLKYAYYLLQHLRLGEHDQSTAIPSLSRDVYNRQPSPIPDLSVQHSIVRRIDALFVEIDDGERALAAARDGVETYRKSLLRAAVTGELTADWRTDNPCLEPGEDLLRRVLAERCNSKASDLGPTRLRDGDHRALPESWCWASVEAVGEVQLGRQRAPQHHAGENMRPYLRVANVLEDRLDLADVKWMNFTPAEFETFALRRGDVLLNEGQSPDLIGRPAIYRGEIEGCCFQKTLLRFRAGSLVEPDYALIVFRHYMWSGRFKREARITTNIGHLTQVRFLPMEFPLPSLSEQKEIIQSVSQLELAVVDLPLDGGDSASLRQSILAAAFRGDLVA